MNEKIDLQETEKKIISRDETVQVLLDREQRLKESEAIEQYRAWYDQEFARCEDNRMRLVIFNVEVAEVYFDAGYLDEALGACENALQVAIAEKDIVDKAGDVDASTQLSEIIIYMQKSIADCQEMIGGI